MCVRLGGGRWEGVGDIAGLTPLFRHDFARFCCRSYYCTPWSAPRLGWVEGVYPPSPSGVGRGCCGRDFSKTCLNTLQKISAISEKKVFSSLLNTLTDLWARARPGPHGPWAHGPWALRPGPWARGLGFKATRVRTTPYLFKYRLHLIKHTYVTANVNQT